MSLRILCLLAPVFLTPAVRPADTDWTMKTYTYKSVGETAIKADVHRPADTKARPVVVWIHGGALIVGGRNSVPSHLMELCKKEGYALVSVDYRLAPEVKLPAIIEDIKDFFRWLHQEGPKTLNLDTKRIVVTGGSAGGYLTLMTGICVEPKPAALVAYWGYGDVDGAWYTQPSEFYRTRTPLVEREEAMKAVGGKVLSGTDGDAATAKARGNFYRYLRQNGEWTRTVTGFDPKTERAKLDPYCPVRNVSPAYPTTMLIHGTADTDVPYELSAAMAKEFTRHKVKHELVTLEGAGHGLSGAPAKEVAAAYVKAADFVRAALREERR